MTLEKGFIAVGASAAVCAVAGGIMGHLIGLLAPSAYYGLSGASAHPSFSPVEFGVGLGIAQGALVGGFLGIAIVAIVTWYEIQTDKREPDTKSDE